MILGKETGCQWANSTITREEEKELKEKIENVQEKITNEEENICQQRDQLHNLFPTTNTELATPKGN